jgi:hypothetical protein
MASHDSRSTSALHDSCGPMDLDCAGPAGRRRLRAEVVSVAAPAVAGQPSVGAALGCAPLPWPSRSRQAHTGSSSSHAARASAYSAVSSPIVGHPPPTPTRTRLRWRAAAGVPASIGTAARAHAERGLSEGVVEQGDAIRPDDPGHGVARVGPSTPRDSIRLRVLTLTDGSRSSICGGEVSRQHLGALAELPDGSCPPFLEGPWPGLPADDTCTYVGATEVPTESVLRIRLVNRSSTPGRSSSSTTPAGSAPRRGDDVASGRSWTAATVDVRPRKEDSFRTDMTSEQWTELFPLVRRARANASNSTRRFDHIWRKS